MPYNLEVLPNAHTNLGEGPHWDIETQTLFFIDLDRASLLRYDYTENKTYRAKIEGEDFVGFAIPIEGQKHKFVAGCRRRAVVVHWDGVSTTAKVEKTLFTVQPGDKYIDNRFNDAKCDPRGRLFAGTMDLTKDVFEKRYGEFYRYDKSGKVLLVKPDVGISNGLAWNLKLKKFYYIDTVDQEVKEYDYDVETGNVSNPRVLISFDSPDAQFTVCPDGMTIDTEGNLYVALFQGSAILKVDPNGKLLEKIEMPCKHVTSVAFGGPKLDELFVTTCAIDDKSPKAGETFKITGLGAKGLPMTKAQI